MSDKRNNDGFEDFDWDDFDMMTSGQSSYNGSEQGEPLSRRNRSASSGRGGSRRRSSGGTRQTRNTAETRLDEPTPQKSRKKRRGKKRKKLTEKQLKLRKRLRAFVLIAMLIMIVVGSSVFVGMYAAVSREIKDMNIKNLALNSTSFIYYTDIYGTEHELEQIQTAENRIWLDADQIAPVMKDAIVSIEDERFYSHHGVDVKRTAGATIGYVLSKVGIGNASYGGSTITQQVIKNITNEKDATPTRKIKEMMRAIALENELTKDEILTLYLNIVYFANGCNGVEAAANVYFDKHASELTIEEAASIAGITQFPSQFDPYVHPDNNIEKRNTVLAKMLELGYITQLEYEIAVSSDLNLNYDYIENGSDVSSYFVDQVISDVIADLQTRRGYSSEFAEQQVYNGGLKIYATVDLNIQETLNEVYESTEGFPVTGMGAQSAMVIMDPYTGQVKGLVGGLGEKTDVRGFNRATQARRQPGSSIKPLSVYGPAVDMGKISPVTIVKDEPITIGHDNWKPKNSYNDFYGDMTVREAVARSSNIPAVNVLEKVGISTSFGYLQNKFHLSNLSEDDKNYSSLSLGGLTNGVSPLEMAAAYSVFVNGGKYIKPYTYTKVVDSAGQEILTNSADSSQSISAAAAYITSDLLSAVVNDSVGTARGASLDSGMPTYGKTGTTDDDIDKWFVGFTPYYVGAVWYGFDSPSSIKAAGVSGNPCITVWKNVMDNIHSGLMVKQLERPTNVVEATVCLRSGMLATSTCNAVTSYFVDGDQPKTLCNSSHATIESSPSPEVTILPSSSPSEVSEVTSPPSTETSPSSNDVGSDTSAGSGTSSYGGSSSGESSGGDTDYSGGGDTDYSGGDTDYSGGGDTDYSGGGDTDYSDTGTVSDDEAA